MEFISADSMFQNPQDGHLPSTSPSPCAPQEFHGHVSTILMRRSMSLSAVDRGEDVRADDDMSDDGAQLGEKKKRLNLEQVKALEKSFELGNKLEPERKMQLARALGLQPRQIAIWFQNRRARWKTKQLEKDYDMLKTQFEALKADNDSLKAQNKKLHSELSALQTRSESPGTLPMNLKRENEASWINGSQTSSIDVNLATTRTTSTDSTALKSHAINKTSIFPVSAIGQTSLTHALNGSLRPDLHGSRNDQTTTTPDVGFCNMMNCVEEQPGFWQWPEQQHFR